MSVCPHIGVLMCTGGSAVGPTLKESAINLRKLKAAVVATAAVAGVAVAAAPARASVCEVGGGSIICEYGVSVYTFANGTRQEFAIGTDRAVWTRWNDTAGKWTAWSSLGGVATSRVTVEPLPHDTFSIVVTGTDGRRWERVRYSYPSGAWSDNWEPYRG
ncbi:hypothetical protein GCM10015535_04430 [Streptomyces gelaticus]|uniref:PLL-like beta propeller domain-containing protein n=2 Tax=Streptomyces gelaticus TaxID=285446 RepID=A0ABQ2VTB8_9ACTN|nr:hypothetical protein GCM10015535_04430 [Streptomyces gelaticus]